MTDKLDEILSFGYDDPAFIHDIHVLIGGNHKIATAKQAILDWHNKQIESVLDRLKAENTTYTAKAYNEFSVPYDIVIAEAIPKSAIEAERIKLKESSNDQDS